MALLKNTNFTESKSLQLRFEAFNIFNHAQFQFQNSSGLLNSRFVRRGHLSVAWAFYANRSEVPVLSAWRRHFPVIENFGCN